MNPIYHFLQRQSLFTCVLLALLVFTGQASAAEEGHAHADHDGHPEQVVLDDEQVALAGIDSETAGPRTLITSDALFGRVSIPADAIYRVAAPYNGIVTRVHVNVGDSVTPGQALVTVRNTSTLQSYTIDSPAQGEVTMRLVNSGDSTERGVLLELVDLRQVWVDISTFAETIEKLAVGLPVTIRDMHQHEVIDSRITYVSPLMTGGHIATARAVLDNSSGHWRPGMHVTAQLHIDSREVALAVRLEAIQTIDGRPVVFVRQGNTFELHPVELGEDDGEYIEVLGGLTPGSRYATANSFVLKADLLKSGVSHDH